MCMKIYIKKHRAARGVEVCVCMCINAQHRAARGVNIYICMYVYIYIYKTPRCARCGGVCVCVLMHNTALRAV
jgi:hypothetical protein